MTRPGFFRRLFLPSICVVSALLISAASPARAQSVSFAGFVGAVGTGGAGIGTPYAVAVDAKGDVFVSDEFDRAVKEIVAANGQVTYASTTVIIASGFTAPGGLAVDAKGDVFVADGSSGVKEIVAVGGQVSSSSSVVVVGSGMQWADGVAVDASGDVFVADHDAKAVKEIVAVGGVVSTSSTVKTVGSGFYGPAAVVLDASGDVFVADLHYGGAIEEIVAVGGVVSSSSTVEMINSGFETPEGLAFDAAGDLLVADDDYHSIQEIVAVGGQVSSASAVVPVGSGLVQPTGVAVDAHGNIFVADLYGYAVDEIEAGAVNFGSVNVGSSSASYTLGFNFTDWDIRLTNIAVFTQGATGGDFQVANGGTCTTGYFYEKGDSCTVNVTFNPLAPGSRNGAVVFFDDSTPSKALITLNLYGTGVAPLIAFAGTNQAANILPTEGWDRAPASVAVDAAGNIYFDESLNYVGSIFKMPWTGGSYGAPVDLAPNTGFGSAAGIAVDGAGNVFVANANQLELDEIPWDGSGYRTPILILNSGISGSYPSFTGLALDSQGNIFLPVVATPPGSAVYEVPHTATGYGSPVKLPFTGLREPQGIALDAAGNIYINDTYNGTILELPVSGSGYGSQITVASGLSLGSVTGNGLAIDSAGDIYSINGTRAVIEFPWNGSSWSSPVSIFPSALNIAANGLALDAGGNVYEADRNYMIGKFDRADPPSLTFPDTDMGSASPAQDVTVENIGNSLLQVSDYQFSSSDFDAQGGDTTCQASAENLPAGASCVMGLRFTPQSQGTRSGNVSFTDNSLNASPAHQTVPLNGKTSGAPTPTINWGPLADIAYGTALGSGDLNATATSSGTDISADGTFAYTITSVGGTPATAATILPGGSNQLCVQWTPSSSYSSQYLSASLCVPIQVNAASTSIAWIPASPISYPATLGAAQFNASASAGGTNVSSDGAFTYYVGPVGGTAAGTSTVLPVGSDQLCVMWTPTSSYANDYSPSSLCATITVNLPASSGLNARLYAVGNNNAVYGYNLNPTTGALTAIAGSPFPSSAAISGNFLSVDPLERFVYVANRGTVTAYSINSITGALTEIAGSPFAAPIDDVGVTVDPLGRFLFLSGNNSAVATMVIHDDGTLTNAPGSPYSGGAADFYQSAVTPNGQFVYFNDDVSGKIAAFSIGSNGVLTPTSNSPFAVGINLSGIVIDPSGTFLYTTDATNNTSGGRIYGFTIQSDGNLLAMTGSPWTFTAPVQSITMDPTGRFLYATTCYGHAYLLAYAVDPTTGQLTAMPASPYTFANPNFQVIADPTGQFLYSTGWTYQNYIIGFAISGATGAVTMPGSTAAASGPTGEGIANIPGVALVSVIPASSSITAAQALPVTVIVSGGVGHQTPTGTVSLSTTGYTSTPVTLAKGSAAFTIPAGALPAGLLTLTASYAPDQNSASLYNNATGSAPVTVGGAPTISWTPTTPITYGAALGSGDFTATASYSGNNISADGTFAFYVGTVGGTAATATTILPGGSNQLCVQWTPSSSYSAIYSPASLCQAIVVNAAATLVTYSPASPIISPAPLGAAQFNASVSAGSTNVSSDGTFTYYVGSVGGTVANSSTVLAAGTDQLCAQWSPSSSYAKDYNSSSLCANITVNAATSINWTPASPITYPATLSAAQFNASAMSGSTNISADGTFTYSIGSVGGTVATTSTILPGGSDTLCAQWTPSSSYTSQYGSASLCQSITVSAASTSINWSPSSTNIIASTGPTAGQLDATAAAGAINVTSDGTITYHLSTPAGAPISIGATLSAGATTICAVWAPSSGYAADYSGSNTCQSFTVINTQPTTTTLAADHNPMFVSNPVTFTATVTPTTGSMVPTGSVTFYAGGTSIGTATLSPSGTGASAVAKLTTTSLTACSNVMTATYPGDTNNQASSSATMAEVVEDFAIASTGAASSTVQPGKAASFTFTVSPVSPATTFPAAITFAATGLPKGATYSFSPASIASGASSTTVTFTVITPVTTLSRNQSTSRWPLMTLALLLLPLAGGFRRAGRRLNRTLSLLLVLAAGLTAAAALSGCGGVATGYFGQAPSTATIAVTGSSGSLNHIVNVSLTVE